MAADILLQAPANDALHVDMLFVLAKIHERYPHLAEFPCIAISAPDAIVPGDTLVLDDELLAEVAAIFERHNIPFTQRLDRVLTVGPSHGGQPPKPPS